MHIDIAVVDEVYVTENIEKEKNSYYLETIFKSGNGNNLQSFIENISKVGSGLWGVSAYHLFLTYFDKKIEV